MASRRAYTNPAMRQAPQAAWAAARRPPSDKGGAMLPQTPQPSKKLLGQQPPLPPGVVMGPGKGPVVGASNAGRKPPVILPRVNRQQQQQQSAAFVGAQGTLSASAVTARALRDANARPSLRTLSLLALQRGAPFIGFGLVDNAIMIVAGDYIEMSIGLSLGIGTMTAAALGNILADVVGLNLGGAIEEASHRMGIPEPSLTAGQRGMGFTQAVTYAGSSLGIALGCLLGMLPLLFIDHQAKEAHPAEIFGTLASRAAALLRCQRVVILQLDPVTGAVVQEYSTGGSGHRHEALPRPLAEEMLAQVLATREGLRYRREPSWWQLQQARKAEEAAGPKAALALLDGGATEALATATAAPPSPQPQPSSTRKRAGVESALCLPVLDQQGRTVAVVAAVNRLGGGDDGRLFGREDAKALAGLCAQTSEALTNLTRRPEEHVSLGENLELLAAHSALPLREYRPTLKALLAGEADKEEKAGLVRTDHIVPIPIRILPSIAAAAATLVPANARAPAAPVIRDSLV